MFDAVSIKRLCYAERGRGIGMASNKRIFRLILVMSALGGVASCGSSSPTASTEVEHKPSADLYESDADTSGSKGDETYAEYDTRRGATASPGDVAGFGCTQDCSGHDAGFQWAEEHSVTDESECGGNSWSFQEGCAAYAREQSEEKEDASSEDEGGLDADS